MGTGVAPTRQAAAAPLAGVTVLDLTNVGRSSRALPLCKRVGRLYPKTPTVLIACTAAHRDTGVFDAARYGIDRLKEIAPIWKKEVSPDGEFWVEGEYTPKPGE